jgi:hypothetical protein
MPTDLPAPKAMLWTGRVLTALAILFLLLDSALHVVKERHAVEGTVALGWDAALLPAIGLIELACLALYAIPRTSALGAVLLTGYLGGAIATNWRAGMPLFNDLFPLLLALVLWGGLWLRDARLRSVLPLLGKADA